MSNHDILSCPRCGKEHRGLVGKPFTNDLFKEGMPDSHWTMCPDTQEPILFTPGTLPEIDVLRKEVDLLNEKLHNLCIKYCQNIYSGGSIGPQELGEMMFTNLWGHGRS